MKKIISVFAMLIAVAYLLAVHSGCETTDGTSGLTVTPSESALSGASNSVVFTVSDATNSNLRVLSLPLEWSVSNPALGSINERGGYSAVYVRNSGNGANVIRVKDQYGAEGIATVHQN